MLFITSILASWDFRMQSSSRRCNFNYLTNPATRFPHVLRSNKYLFFLMKKLPLEANRYLKDKSSGITEKLSGSLKID